jgi:hypothetical protein
VQIIAGLLTAAVGMVIGAVVSAYALMVPAEGRLPGLSLSPLVEVRPRWVVALGSVIACAMSVVMVAALGWYREFWVLWFPGLLGIGLAIVDVRRRRLPFVITGAMYAISASAIVAVAMISGDPAPVIRALVAVIAAIGVFLALALALPGQLGLGDVLMIGWIALTLGWLGWEQLGIGLLAGLLLQATAAATLIALGDRRMEGGLPMGPALIAGWLVGVVWLVTG